jgi:gliding motility-associated lipoprotein GldH
MTKRLAIFVFALTLIFSCTQQENIHYQKYLSTPTKGWTHSDTLTFEFDVDDTLSTFDFWVTLRSETSYAYSNVFLFVYTEFPNGKSALDTVNYMLAQPSGKWLGDVSGSMVESTLIYKHTTIPYKGAYKMNVIQAMRDERLEGIKDVGIKIVKVRAPKK